MLLEATCDDLGNSLKFFVTGGLRSDYLKALDFIKDMSMEALISEKRYEVNYMVKAGGVVNAEPVMPPLSDRKTPRKHDKELYKERNLI